MKIVKNQILIEKEYIIYFTFTIYYPTQIIIIER